jgi:hypothetical protein
VAGAEGLDIHGQVSFGMGQGHMALPSATGKIKLAAQGLGKKGRSHFAGFTLRSEPRTVADDSRPDEQRDGRRSAGLGGGNARDSRT